MVKKKESLHIHGEKKAMCLKKTPTLKKNTRNTVFLSLLALFLIASYKTTPTNTSRSCCLRQPSLDPSIFIYFCHFFVLK